MRKLKWSALSSTEKTQALLRPALSLRSELDEQVRTIVNRVRGGGDEALIELTERFDGVRLECLEASPNDFELAESELSSDDLLALERAFDQIYKFHVAQFPRNIDLETSPGLRCEKRFLPLERVGLYVPGGSAVLPSTLLMMGIPATIANSPLRVVCTPPSKSGRVHPAILVAARLCKIDRVYKVGGAQAISALAYGTETVPKVDKIFGPGNSFVTQAKLLVSQDPSGATSDMPAGPSEVLIVSDGSCPASFTAADLLSQAEHGSDSQVVLVSTSPAVFSDVARELEKHLSTLGRETLARAALEKSLLIEVQNLDEAFAVSNAYAPEHLILQIANAREASSRVKNAGSVFLGTYSAEAVGDYASGTNHVLPTYGYARSMSGLSLESFMKSISFQELSPQALIEIGPTVETLAQLEGLEAHALAVAVRRRRLLAEVEN